MEQYYREDYFRGIAGRVPIMEQSANYSQPEYVTFDVFLSYNTRDKEVVKGVFHHLRSQGLKVYLDFMVDKDLDRNFVSERTAKRIQNRLKNSKSLIYAQSPNATMSKWMPWELGYIDGHTGKCMILPIVPSSGYSFPNQEYLLLYPRIKPSIHPAYSKEVRVFTENKPMYGENICSYIRG